MSIISFKIFERIFNKRDTKKTTNSPIILPPLDINFLLLFWVGERLWLLPPCIFLSQIPPIKAVLGGFSRASKLKEESAFTNEAIDKQSCFGSHVKQFGHLLATLLGHCHGSSEQVKVNIDKLH